MKWISLVAVISISMTLISCKQDEMDDLAKAQKCLDEVPQNAVSNANACFAYVAKYTSQQANILKCSIKMTSGGLVETKMVKAYKAVDDKANTSREATFMSVLALDQPTVSEGYDISIEADKYCQLSGVPGLQYISGIVKIGSFMAKTMAAYNTNIDFNDTAAVTAAITDLIAQCNVEPRDTTKCPTDLSAIGSSAGVLADGYCSADNADSEVCENINAAVTGANGNPNAVGDALMCYLGNKKYDTATGKCIP